MKKRKGKWLPREFESVSLVWQSPCWVAMTKGRIRVHIVDPYHEHHYDPKVMDWDFDLN